MVHAVDGHTTDLAAARAARPELAAVADNVTALMRSFTKARARLVAVAEHDLEWSSHLLLKCIGSSEQPMRAGALADFLQSDPSTVSRQVAALVKDGYVERQADPDDGRASLLVLTGKARDLLAEHDQIRLEFFARIVDGWSDAELKRFAAQLERFTRAYESANTEWLAERIESRSGRAGSKH
jgi:DNA-binding MarR family transcriptional regulator